MILQFEKGFLKMRLPSQKGNHYYNAYDTSKQDYFPSGDLSAASKQKIRRLFSLSPPGKDIDIPPNYSAIWTTIVQLAEIV